jgi:hypothetical protein
VLFPLLVRKYILVGVILVMVALRSLMVTVRPNGTRTRLVICTRSPILKASPSESAVVRVPCLDLVLARVSLSRTVTSL